MKKKLAIVVLAACLVFTGCGSSASSDESGTVASDASTESTVAEEESIEIVDETVADAGIDAFISMGDYKGLELEKTVTEVTDDDVDSYIQSALSSYPMACEDGTKIEEGMTANIDYVGKIDEEEFDGGSSTDYDLEIGSGTFIDGFEDQLVGHVKGDTFDVNVTFPDDYSNEDVAGKDATFSVTINEVKSVLEAPTDEWCQANTEYDTVEDYKVGLKEELEEYYESSDESTFQQAVLQKLMDITTFKQLPQDLYDEYYNMQVDSLKEYAEDYGMEYGDDFLEQIGYSEEYLEEIAESYAKIELVSDYIMGKEGLTTDSDEYKEKETEVLSNAGYDDKDAAIEAGISETTIEMAVKNYLIIDVVIDNATVTETKQSVAGESVSEE